MAKVCKNGLSAVGNIAHNNDDNQVALRDHIDVVVRALGQHIDNAEVGSIEDIIVTNNVYMVYG